MQPRLFRRKPTQHRRTPRNRIPNARG
jgi:hypothetical protein